MKPRRPGKRKPSKATSGAAPKAPAVQYIHTTNIPSLLTEHKLSLFVSTYQAQRLLVFDAHKQTKLSMLMRVFPKPMGLALESNRMALCCKNQIWFFYPVGQIRSSDPASPDMNYDLVFSPRHSHVTGDIQIHQAVWLGDELFFVNTRFSCICKIEDKWSFSPVWKPSFISALKPEDRCHLNGICIRDEKLRYATALGSTDSKEGWRENKATGGIVIDVESGDIICSGLSMPHTPVWHQEKLWVLDSGRGRLVTVDVSSGDISEVITLPGFLRGLSFHGDLAFIGLCKLRDDGGKKQTFRGIAIEERLDELKCAIYVVNIKTGESVGFIEFQKGIEELFDVCVLPETVSPHVVGLQDDTIDSVIVVPPEVFNQNS